MSETTVLVVGYIACAIASFWMLQWWWRDTLDAEAADLAIFGIISLLGPIAVIIAIGVVSISAIAKRLPEGTVWSRRQ